MIPSVIVVQLNLNFPLLYRNNIFKDFLTVTAAMVTYIVLTKGLWQKKATLRFFRHFPENTF